MSENQSSMKTIARIAVALVLFALAAPAVAGTARVYWEPSTQRVDGTPVTISVYNVYYGTEPGQFPQFVTVTEGALEYLFEQLAPGAWYFAVTAVDDDGLESGLSAVVSKTIEAVPDPLPPVPPGGVTVPGGAVQYAYVINQAEGRIALVPVGTVPAGTPCDASQAIRDANGVTAFLVPESAVVWSGSVRRSVVFSPCGN